MKRHEPIPIDISCAVGKELIKIIEEKKYTNFYRQLASKELLKRNERKRKEPEHMSYRNIKAEEKRYNEET